MSSFAAVLALREIAALFGMRADFVDGFPYGSGHINDTNCASFDQAGLLRIRYILQRINTNVFKTPVQLMEKVERVTHNDTKTNNVLLDDVTAEGVCVIDLETTMPGSALYGFGDMVRTATPTEREDSTDLGKQDVRMNRFESLVSGYMEATRSFLNAAEVENLAFSGMLRTLECGIRFLTDFLLGDVYFKIKHPDHNIGRCRNQFAFVGSFKNRLPEMQRIVASHAG
jgi:hypothetical protein